MGYPSGVITEGEKRIYDEAMRRCESETCGRGHKLRPVFTWHYLRPYYLTCDTCNALDHKEE